jgi:hypothetical protein
MTHPRIAISEPSSSSVTDAYREFPATERLTYMDVAARGVISRTVRAALDTHLDGRMLGSAAKTSPSRWSSGHGVASLSSSTPMPMRWPSPKTSPKA